jgi:hypothetical protein
LRLEEDQKIPAADQIHLGEWRIVQNVVLRENAHIPDIFADPGICTIVRGGAIPLRYRAIQLATLNEGLQLFHFFVDAAAHAWRESCFCQKLSCRPKRFLGMVKISLQASFVICRVSDPANVSAISSSVEIN